MNEVEEGLSKETIETFLEGVDPQKYIVAIEVGYSDPKATLVINDPEKGKYLEESEFKPFLWFKNDVYELLYEGKDKKRIDACTKYGIKITKLRISDNNGFAPDRMVDGYNNLATCKYSYNSLIKFFDEGGIDVFDSELKKLFVMFSPIEQFMISSGKRLFKGMDDYENIHRLQFDLETEGLVGKKNAIFQIGIRDNREHEMLLETLGEDVYQRRDSERENIAKFFKIIDIIQPDIITGYNSENFDWPFLFDRAEALNIPITDLAITLNRASKIKRRPSTVKFGGETEHYNQTNMYGYNIIDISHAVRRAMAINSEIKGWGLKYITQYSEIAKPNRVYVPGDKINSTWADKDNDYAFNDKNGDWYIINETRPLKEDYSIVKGNFIVQRYLCDDLWETEQIDNIFNQASFLISKILPTTFQRSSTMGTAGQWKLIMAAWSYENGLAIPELQRKRDFTGGLSRLLNVGYARNVVKLDYAALYPKTQLTHNIFPDLDISGVMKGLLTYVVDTRDEFKFLSGDEKKLYKSLEKKLKEEKHNLSKEEITNLSEEINKHKGLANLYDKKQLPLKILANSWFGSYGAPYIFNWGDSNSAEETTCRGRQYLRLMIRYFTEVYGFKASIVDTDGVDFAYPDNINEIKYIATGEHWKTTGLGGKELNGLEAVLAKFNETYMKGRMGLDIDDVIDSSIKFSRKNYANDIGGKIKLVGNSIKSKKMPVYIEDFLGKGIRMLLDGDGHSFINYYYEYVDKIYNYQIPLVKIASKSKVKISVPEYKKKANLKNKAGNPMPKQAHMELVIKNNIEVDLGDMIYYINTGKSKSHGDIKSEKNKETGVVTLTINCDIIDPKSVERDFELIKELEMFKKALLVIEDKNSKEYTDIEVRINELNSNLYTDEYNVSKYLDSFNKKIKPLLVCFHPDIRKKIILDIVKVKDKVDKTVTEKLKERIIFVKSECELISGIPLKDGDQDSYEELMCMEDKEIRFWTSVGKIPNHLEDESKWPDIVNDYHERMRILKEEGIKHETEKLEDIFRRLEINDLNVIRETGKLPIEVLNIAKTIDDDLMLISDKWGEPIAFLKDIYKYEKEAIERNNYYISLSDISMENRYQEYLDYLLERKFMTGDTVTIETNNVIDIDLNIDKIVETINKDTNITTPEIVKKKKKIKSSDDEDDDESDDENEGDDSDDETPEPTDDYVEINEELDEYKDTVIFKEQLEKANEILSSTELPKIEEDDGWGF